MKSPQYDNTKRPISYVEQPQQNMMMMTTTTKYIISHVVENKKHSFHRYKYQSENTQTMKS